MNRWLAVLAVVAACKSAPKHSAPAHERVQVHAVVHQTTPDDAAFVIANPAVTQARVPARFDAALPAEAEDLGHVVPPPAFVARALATGRDGMRERLLDAAGRVNGPLSPDVANWYGDALGYRVAPTTCAWLVENADKVATDGRALLWELVGQCRDPKFAETLDRDGVPASVVVHWYFRQFGTFPFRERVAKAAAEVARTSTNEDELREIGFAFARLAGDESIAAMKALQASISDPKTRALVGLGMLHSKMPAAQAIGAESCKHPAVADDPMCVHRDGSLGESFEKKRRAATTVDAMIDIGEARATLLAKFPKPRVLAGLEKCARSGSQYRRARCYADIVAIDRPTAVRLAASLQDSDDKGVARMARTLVKFPEPGALEKELVRLGFVLEPAPAAVDPDSQPLVDAHDILVARGKTDIFDVETDQFPNQHDKLLGRLADLAKPALDDVVFEEVPPPDNDGDGAGDYQLYAYTDGLRYALAAKNHGDWYDVDAVIGLLNRLLVARGSDIRMVVLPTGGQEALVLAGPKAGLLAASQQGLVDFGSPTDAEQVGKAFEDKVFDKLSKDGKVIRRDVKLGK